MMVQITLGNSWVEMDQVPLREEGDQLRVSASHQSLPESVIEILFVGEDKLLLEDQVQHHSNGKCVGTACDWTIGFEELGTHVRHSVAVFLMWRIVDLASLSQVTEPWNHPLAYQHVLELEVHVDDPGVPEEPDTIRDHRHQQELCPVGNG